VDHDTNIRVQQPLIVAALLVASQQGNTPLTLQEFFKATGISRKHVSKAAKRIIAANEDEVQLEKTVVRPLHLYMRLCSLMNMHPETTEVVRYILEIIQQRELFPGTPAQKVCGAAIAVVASIEGGSNVRVSDVAKTVLCPETVIRGMVAQMKPHANLLLPAHFVSKHKDKVSRVLDELEHA
jgi:transcription initiation factor TFIIIB Brf1 subunit/transcription initiation factor TFIIB